MKRLVRRAAWFLTRGSGGGGPPKPVEGANDGAAPIRPLHHASHGPPPPSQATWEEPTAPARRSTKHFWFCLIVSRITSVGNFQKRFVERAHQHDRPFDQPRHLLQQPRILDHLEPLREGEVFRLRLDDRLPPLGSSTTFAASSSGT